MGFYIPNTRARNQPLPGEVINSDEHNFEHKNEIAGSQIMRGKGMVASDKTEEREIQPNFWRNSITSGCPFRYGDNNKCIFPTASESWKVRSRGPKFMDHFSQATARYLAMNHKQRQHLINAFYFELGHVQNLQIRRNMIKFLNKIHPDLANSVGEKLILE